jgi:hypothetical protein
MALEGKTVLALDLPGTGQAKSSGSDGRDAHTAYLLGRSCVGLCAEHVLIAARYLKEQTPGGRPGTVELVAVGHVGTAALHAAAGEPDLLDSVKLVRPPASWSGVVRSRQPKLGAAQVVHGALAAYDLPDLAASLGKKAAIQQP